MKRLGFVSILLSSALFALPVGNPQEPMFYPDSFFLASSTTNYPLFDIGSLHGGFYGDYVFNRNLEDQEGMHVDVTKVYTNAGYLALNLCHRIDLFATAGVTEIKIQTPTCFFGSAFAQNQPYALMQLTNAFSWSLGARLFLLQWRCWGVGLEGQYLRSNPKPTFFDTTFAQAPLDAPHMRWKEWQGGAALAYNFIANTGCFAFSAYIGGKWADARLDAGDFTFDISPFTDLQFQGLRAAKHWGYAIGVTSVINRMCGVTVEGRFADEKALHVNMQIAF